jgi:hypothetical protein
LCDPLVNLLSMHGYLGRGIDPNTNLSALDAYDPDDDLIADHE